MSDPFIDALHDRLTQARADTAAPEEHDRERRVAVRRWWEEFVEVLGQKVGAWNERQAPRSPLNFTRQADGAVHVWHRCAEARFARDGDAMRVSTRLGVESAAREAVLALRAGSEGHVVALANGEELRTPTAAAEHLLTPVLVETFAKP
jgi:hypothetical protein